MTLLIAGAILYGQIQADSGLSLRGSYLEECNADDILLRTCAQAGEGGIDGRDPIRKAPWTWPEVASMSRGERTALGFSLWQARALALVNQPSLGARPEGVQAVFAEGGVLDAGPPIPLVAPEALQGVSEPNDSGPELVQQPLAGDAPRGAESGRDEATERAPDIVGLIAGFGWDTRTAIRVFECESGLLPGAISWNGTSYGVAQIWQGHAWRWANYEAEWMVAAVNLGWAWELYSESGWAPWRESVWCHGAW